MHPDDFWAALTLARALQEAPTERGGRRVPAGARAPGDSAAVYNNLGNMSTSMGRLDEATDYFRSPSRSTPT